MMRSLLLAALGLIAAFTSVAQPLPFVDASGIVTSTVRYSAVVKALGEPPASKVMPQGRNNNGETTGGQFTFSYPERGLSFVIGRENRSQADPLVESMAVQAPSEASTPDGLHIGMAQEAALRIVETRYRIEHRYDFGFGDGMSSVSATSAQGHSRRGLSVNFKQGRVDRLSFDMQDPPRLSWSDRRALGAIGMVALILIGGIAWARLRARLRLDQRADTPDPHRPRPVLLSLGVLMFAAAALAGVIGLPLLLHGGYEAYVGLVLVLGVSCGVLFGAGMLTGSRHVAAQRLSWALAAAVVLLIGLSLLR